MPAMLILDKALALDRIVATSVHLEVPQEFARRPFRVATFERIGVAIGTPALVLASAEMEAVASPLPDPVVPSPIPVHPQAPARAIAWHLPHALSWPVLSFSPVPQPEG